MFISMIRFVWICFSLCVVPGVCAGPGTTLDKAGHLPAAAAASFVHDAGTVVEGTEIRHTFIVQNKGAGPLLLYDARALCKCVQVSCDEKVMPGHRGRVRMVFRTAGQTGPQVKAMTLHSNDGQLPELEFEIRARVLPALSVTPDRVFFNGAPGSALDQVVTLSSPDDKPFELTLNRSDLSVQTGFYIEKQDSGKMYRIHFRHKGETAETDRGRLILNTDIAYQTRVVIPVYSRITAPYSIFPEHVDFGRLKLLKFTKTREPDPVRTVNIRFPEKDNFRINRLELDKDLFKTDIEYLEDMGIARIRVQALIRKFPAGSRNFTLNIKTDGAVPQKFSVPVRISPY